MWNFADDRGNIERSAKQIKMKIFPADNIDVEPLIRELMDHNFLIEYQVEDKLYLHIRTFADHQVISRPSKSGLPDYEDSRMTHGVITDDSWSDHGGLTDGRERKGKEGKGKELNPNPNPPVDNSELPPFNPDPDPEEKKQPFKKTTPPPDTTELQDLINQVKVQRPKMPIDNWYMRNSRAHPEAIKHVLRSLLKVGREIDYDMAYIQKALDVEIGKYNAGDEEARCNDFKKPGGMGIGEVLRQAQAASGGGGS